MIIVQSQMPLSAELDSPSPPFRRLMSSARTNTHELDTRVNFMIYGILKHCIQQLSINVLMHMAVCLNAHEDML